MERPNFYKTQRTILASLRDSLNKMKEQKLDLEPKTKFLFLKSSPIISAKPLNSQIPPPSTENLSNTQLPILTSLSLQDL